MNLKTLTFGVALAATSLAAAAAHAAPAPASATYTLSPDPLMQGTVSTSPTITVGAGTTVDDFTFSLLSGYNTSATGLYFEMPTFGLAITSADVSLYAGTPTTPGAELADTGVFDPETATKTLGASLASGDYFLQTSVTVPPGASGAFSVAATVSAAPEAPTWALMILGVGVLGLGLRVTRAGRDEEFGRPSWAPA